MRQFETLPPRPLFGVADAQHDGLAVLECILCMINIVTENTRESSPRCKSCTMWAVQPELGLTNSFRGLLGASVQASLDSPRLRQGSYEGFSKLIILRLEIEFRRMSPTRLISYGQVDSCILYRAPGNQPSMENHVAVRLHCVPRQKDMEMHCS